MDSMKEKDIISLSPYDESFPARLLADAFDMRIDETKRATADIYQKTGIEKIRDAVPFDEGEEKLRLVVDESDEFINDYKNGNITLAKEKGKMVAQLKKDGKYGSKLAIKEETYNEGTTEIEKENILKLQAIQEALVTLSEQIQSINDSVKDIIQGQQNDRLGLYYSGAALYLEATNVSNNELRNQLISQALRSLTDASFQLTLSLQSDIRYLNEKRYKQNKRNQYNLLCEKMESINQSFSVIHQASILKAGIYCQQGEIKAMANVLQEYSRFIEGTIIKNADMLAQCDPRDDGTKLGVWNRRSNLQLDTSIMMDVLSSGDKIMYIENRKDENNEGV